MSATGSVLVRPAARGRPFFLIMSVLLAGIDVFGFSHTVPSDFAAPDFPLILWVHAAVFTAWLVLLVLQPVLVQSGSIRLHKRLGWAGVALACAMVALGAIAILLALWANAVPPFYPHGLFLIRGVVGLLLFAGLVAAGALQRRKPGWHKRLMLCASIVVVLPGLERAMPLDLFGADWPFAVDGLIDTIALAGPAADLIGQRRVHPAYLWALGAIGCGQLAVYVLAPSSIISSLLHALGAAT